MLASLATVVLLPDQSYPRCLFAALPFLLIIRLDARRWALICGVSTVASVFIWFQYQRGEARRLMGLSWHMLASNAFLALVVWFGGRGPAE